VVVVVVPKRRVYTTDVDGNQSSRVVVEDKNQFVRCRKNANKCRGNQSLLRAPLFRDALELDEVAVERTRHLFSQHVRVLYGREERSRFYRYKLSSMKHFLALSWLQTTIGPTRHFCATTSTRKPYNGFGVRHEKRIQFDQNNVFTGK
jgi:hypothetical protein